VKYHRRRALRTLLESVPRPPAESHCSPQAPASILMVPGSGARGEIQPRLSAEPGSDEGGRVRPVVEYHFQGVLRFRVGAGGAGGGSSGLNFTSGADRWCAGALS
jgi:hypothetical protein